MRCPWCICLKNMHRSLVISNRQLDINANYLLLDRQEISVLSFHRLKKLVSKLRVQHLVHVRSRTICPAILLKLRKPPSSHLNLRHLPNLETRWDLASSLAKIKVRQKLIWIVLLQRFGLFGLLMSIPNLSTRILQEEKILFIYHQEVFGVFDIPLVMFRIQGSAIEIFPTSLVLPPMQISFPLSRSVKRLKSMCMTNSSNTHQSSGVRR